MDTVQSDATDGRVQCPHCKTTKLRVLNRIDRIEKIYGSRLMNRMRARRGDTIYHCIYCRLQFYDPRKPVRAARESGANRQPAGPSPSRESPEADKPISVAVIAPPATPEPAHDGTNFTSSVTVRGSIQGGEDIYVDGRIEGTLACRAHRITIGPNAHVKASVRAADLEVRGTLRGNLQIESRTILRDGSNVTGQIRTSDIVIEDGATFKGSVDLIRKQPQLPLA